MISTLVKCACSSCGQTVEFDADIAGELIPCPNCGQTILLFIPGQENSKPQIKIEMPPSAPAHRSLQKPSETIRTNAQNFTIASIIILGIGVISGLISTATYFGDAHSRIPIDTGGYEGRYTDTELLTTLVTGSVITGILLSIAFCLFLISQIIHIRANTTKDP